MIGPRYPHMPWGEPQVVEALPDGSQVSVVEYEDGHVIHVVVPRGSRVLRSLLDDYVYDFPIIDAYVPENINDMRLYFGFWREKS